MQSFPAFPYRNNNFKVVNEAFFAEQITVPDKVTSVSNAKEDRSRDIKRTAEEIARKAESDRAKAFDRATEAGAVRAEYLRKWTSDKFPHVVQTLNAVALSGELTGDEFLKLYILTRIGGGKAEDIEIDNKTLAILMHTDTRSWQKAKNSIAAKGWIDERPTYRNGGQSVNSYSLKNPVLTSLEKIDPITSEVEIGEGQTSTGGESNKPGGDGQTNHPFLEILEKKI
jgi:hypothetical protein